jgi:hypothetical protein
MELRFHYENLAKHGVTPEEADEAIHDPKGCPARTKNGAYLSIGKTIAGRFLETCYRKLPDGSALVFHAMDAREHQIKRYKKRV